MIKQTVSYEDFDGNAQTEDLWFNISKTRLTDHLVKLETDVEEIQELLAGPKRDLTIPEIQTILAFVKEITRIGYGVRSEDGKRFRQTDEVWQDFKDSAVYDEFLFGLFENPEKAMEFIQNVMPKDLMERAAAEQNQQKLPFADGSNVPAVGTDVKTNAVANPLEGLTQAQIEALVRQATADQTTK